MALRRYKKKLEKSQVIREVRRRDESSIIDDEETSKNETKSEKIKDSKPTADRRVEVLKAKYNTDKLKDSEG